jgi:DNA polymerase-3 subunit gamma/tau
LTDTLLLKDLGKAFLILDEIIRQGFEPDLIVQGLADHFRNLLVAKDPRTLALVEGGNTLVTRYKNQSSIASRSFLLSALSILNDTNIALPRANNKRLYLEISLGKINHLQDLLSVDLIQEKKTKVTSEDLGKPAQNLAIDKEVNPIFQAPPNEEEQPSPAEREAIATTKTEKSTGIPQPQQNTGQLKEEGGEVNKRTEADQNKKETSPNSRRGQEKTDLLNTPNFSNFQSLISKIKKEEAHKKEARKNLSLEAIDEIWQDHLNYTRSKRVKTTLRLAQKNLEDRTLHIWVPNQMSREIILQETALMDKVREQLGVDDLILNVKTDISRFPGWEEIETKKVMTNREKYEMMVNKNPALADLRRIFDLKVDKD